MAVRFDFLYPTGNAATLFVTLERESDGKFWDNNSTQSWLAAPSDANRKISCTEGTGLRIGSYKATNAGDLGDAGWVLVNVHETTLAKVVRQGRVYVVNGNEVDLPNRIPKRSHFDGTVQSDGGNTATTFKIDSTLGAKAADYFGDSNGGMVLTFLTGTANEGHARRVTAFNTTTDFITVESAFPSTPTASDAFTLGWRIEV